MEPGLDKIAELIQTEYGIAVSGIAQSKGGE
jgi:nicotinamide mononucleotide (NMN) deamidase PncC